MYRLPQNCAKQCVRSIESLNTSQTPRFNIKYVIVSQSNDNNLQIWHLFPFFELKDKSLNLPRYSSTLIGWKQQQQQKINLIYGLFRQGEHLKVWASISKRFLQISTSGVIFEF